MKLSPLDRWARTPLDDAISSDHPECAKHLQRANAQKGGNNASKPTSFRVLNIRKSVICKKRMAATWSPYFPKSPTQNPLTRASLRAKTLRFPNEGALTKSSEETLTKSSAENSVTPPHV